MMAAFDHELLRERLRRAWQHGAFLSLAWSAERDGLLVLLVERRVFLDACRREPSLWSERRYRAASELLARRREFGDAARLVRVVLAGRPDAALGRRMEGIVQRYSIGLSRRRAVALVDLVNFTRLSPFEQLARLAGLEQALCRAEAALAAARIAFAPVRTTTGDGFYLWEDRGSAPSEVPLLMLILLTFAGFVDAGESEGYGAGDLKACLGIGACFNLHRIARQQPQDDTFIVGEITFELARLMNACRPGQLLVGLGRDGRRLADWTSAVTRCNVQFDRPASFEHNITARLTAEEPPGEAARVRRYDVRAKHGWTYTAANLEVEVERRADHARHILGVRERAGRHAA